MLYTEGSADEQIGEPSFMSSSHPNEAQWLAIARRALAAYGLAQAECSILARTHNVVFLAQGGSRRYVLRLHTYALNTHRLRAEIAWLSYLADAHQLPVPRPLYTREGAPYVLAQDDPQMIGVLFVYQDGEEKSLEALDSQIVRPLASFWPVYTAPPKTSRLRLTPTCRAWTTTAYSAKGDAMPWVGCNPCSAPTRWPSCSKWASKWAASLQH